MVSGNAVISLMPGQFGDVEHAKRRLRLVPALGEFRCSLEFGALDQPPPP